MFKPVQELTSLTVSSGSLQQQGREAVENQVLKDQSYVTSDEGVVKEPSRIVASRTTRAGSIFTLAGNSLYYSRCYLHGLLPGRASVKTEDVYRRYLHTHKEFVCIFVAVINFRIFISFFKGPELAEKRLSISSPITESFTDSD